MKITIEIEGAAQSFELGEDVVQALKTIAARNELPLESALIQAIATEKFLGDAEAEGASFLVKRGDEMVHLDRVATTTIS